MVSVIYISQCGTSKRYAETLASKIGCECYSFMEAKESPLEDKDIIYVGWRGGPKIAGLEFYKTNYNVIAAVCVGLLPINDKDMALIRKKNGMDNIFYVRGGMDRSKLNGMQKFILGLVNIKMALFDHSEEDKKVREVMNKGGDFSSDDQLQPVIDWYASYKD